MLKKQLFLPISFFLFVLFFLHANSGLDPDFGWHIRMGEVILTTGIPATDPFSYSMSFYPFVDHEWLTNVLIAKLYSVIGLTGLALLAAGVSFFAFFLQAHYSEKKYVLLPFLFSSISLLPYLGIRPQVQSWLFVSVLLLLFLHEKFWLKFRFFLPFLFLLWVNLHGSFAFGVLLCLLYVVVRQVKTKKILSADWVVVVLSIGATFINPYHLRSWWEVWMQMTDSGLRWSIQEWMPALFFLNIGFIFFLPLSLAFIIRYRKKFRFIELFIYCLLLLFGLSSARHLPFWFLIAIPVTSKGIAFFLREIQTIPFAKNRLKKAIIAYLTTFFLIFILDTSLNIHFNDTRFTMYPEKAVAYLQTHPFQGNLFAHYNWGGYLIWKYPEKKVFIDGRMPSWRDDTQPLGSSNNAFREYLKIFNGKINPSMTFEQYKISTVLIGREDDRMLPGWLQANIERVLGVKFPDPAAFKKQLLKMGMKVVYQDDIAIIYQKID